MREAEGRYAKLFNAAIMGIFQTDAAGALLGANPSMAAMLGYATTEAFLASDDEALKRIYDEIDRMEPSTYKVARHTVYSEKADLFLLPAVVLLLLGLGTALAVTRRLP